MDSSSEEIQFEKFEESQVETEQEPIPVKSKKHVTFENSVVRDIQKNAFIRGTFE